MTISDHEWRPLLDALVQRLVETGDLTSPCWVAAFVETPRHIFVPEFVTYDDMGQRSLLTSNGDNYREWLVSVYSDDSLITQDVPHALGYRTPEDEPLYVPTSSATMPSLMARMLETLDVHEDQRVLEIGTGTGYNAALLSHRLGAHNVVSIDLDSELIASARTRLAGLGYAPTLAVGDGRDGVPEHGPYDRIIATAAVPDIPASWIDQLAVNGRLLVNLRGELAGDTLCLLTKTDEATVSGPVLPIGGNFMWLRTETHEPALSTPQPIKRPSVINCGSTGLQAARLVNDPNFRFLLQLQIVGAESLYHGEAYDPDVDAMRSAVVLTAFDGSRADVFLDGRAGGTSRVVQRGPRALWDMVELTAELVDRFNNPGPGHFRVTATGNTQFVWLDTDDGPYRWTLPLV